MDIKTKQRLVGAVVLVSLLVIFLPMILTGGGEFAPRLGSDAIPEAPEYQFEPLPVPQPIAPMPQSIGEAARPETERPPAGENVPAAPPSAATAPADSTASKPPVSGWVVQIGSFGDEKNANKLSDQLRAKGYDSFVEASRDDGKTVYRVRIGPELTRELATALQQKLVSDGQPAGLILTYP